MLAATEHTDALHGACSAEKEAEDTRGVSGAQSQATGSTTVLWRQSWVVLRQVAASAATACGVRGLGKEPNDHKP